MIVTVLIPLPLFYNPEEGRERRPVEDEKFQQTADELAQRFGGGMLHRFREDPPQGFWWNRGIIDQDTLALLEVDIADTSENRAWLTAYAREVLRKRFQQRAIYLKFVGPVQTLTITEEEIGDK